MILRMRNRHDGETLAPLQLPERQQLNQRLYNVYNLADIQINATATNSPTNPSDVKGAPGETNRKT